MKINNLAGWPLQKRGDHVIDEVSRRGSTKGQGLALGVDQKASQY